MSDAAAIRAPRILTWPALPVLIGLVALLFGLHISIGAKHLPLATVAEALLARDESQFDHMIIWNLRLPRAIFAVAVGAALSVAGALMQGVTRNPLAAPGVLGLTAGASFAVVIGIAFLGSASPNLIPILAAAGALGAALLVYTIARWVPGGATPLTLVLSGAAVSAFLGAIIAMAHLLNSDNFDNLRVWLSGSLAGRDITVFYAALPWLAVAMAMAMGLARQVTVLAMGDEVAAGLGVRTGMLKVQLLAVVVVLTACSVAIAGPLGFIGLVIPHAVRLFVGSDYRWIVPYSAIVGAAYLLSVDIVARVAIAPREISTGIITALIGAPLFIHLVRQRAR